MQELSRKETIHLLETAADGMLALCDSGKPYCIPFGFVLVDRAIYLSLFPTGRKWRIIHRNPKVCFSVYLWNEDRTRWTSAIIEGKLEAVEDMREIEMMVRANIAKMGLEPEIYLKKRMDYYKKNIDNPKGLKIFKISAAKVQGRTMKTLVGS